MAITKASDLAKLLADGVVGTTEIGDGQITTAKIADSAITTDKLASNAVTAAQLSVSGDDIPYDNSVSGMSANTLQEAIDYLNVVTGGGSAGAQATYTRDAFTATEGQTTFTTSNGYTLGYVQVFMNGVLLALTDYVANNETTVVLNVGASAGDEIVIVAYDSFAISEVLRTLNISASFPDDGLTLNASGDLLLGTTVDDLYSATTGGGLLVEPHGTLTIARETTSSTQPALIVNDTGVSEQSIQIRRDGAAQVAVGMVGTDPYLASYDGTGLLFGNTRITPYRAGVGNLNDQVDLGHPTTGARFRDLYLSGGVYLGGTSASNHLDDYEDGTFTPSISGGLNATSGTSTGSYLKIGNVVHIDINIYRPADVSSTAQIEIGNLPFTKENNGLTSHLNVALRYANVTGLQVAGFSIGGGTTSGRIRVFPEGSGTYGDLQHSAFTSSYSAIQISGSYICY